MKEAGVDLEALDGVIRNKYIPALLGRTVSDSERDMLALPASLGGAAIGNTSKVSLIKYDSSKSVTAELTNLVVGQQIAAVAPDTDEAKRVARRAGHHHHKADAERIMQSLPAAQSMALALAQHKGAAALITAKPIEHHGFHLAKRDYRDALLLRYGWPVQELPSTCACGQPFSVDHSQTCCVGGFIHMRHDHVRDLIASQMREVYRDVQTEPPLTPLEGEVLQPRSANTSDDARADIRINGFWTPQQSAFFDVRVFYPLARTYREQNLSTLLRVFEAEKKRQYGDRIIQVERGTFTPLVFSTTGTMGKEASNALKKLAHKLALKRDEPYSAVMGLLRCRLSFCLLRSAIACLRGTRRRVVALEEDRAVVILREAAV